VSYTVLHRNDLPYDENTYEFQGFQHHDTNVSFSVDPVARHYCTNTYEEIFTIQEGVATLRSIWHAGSKRRQIILVPAEVPHKFMNLSDKPLKQIDIHVNKQFITDWLED
jgi:mannose-6-phosphate isomerase-like protein (cupin superfamily)